MTVVRTDSAAGLRGTAVGSLTAALAVAAHGMAGGSLPTGAVAAQLAILAVTLGTIAATVARANRVAVLWLLLGAGQLLAHLLMAATSHSHDSWPGPTMFGAHVVAVSLGAALIACGARLSAAVSRVVRAVAAERGPVPVPTVRALADGADQPLHSALFLAASVSHRGPPVRLPA
ncbi:hypothetical protein A5699_20360 [Mycobacterium sp. E802]|uniref:hypothetical protein n=1 Tax=Mycobacterium sp. E802 TaxID=1834152 RepID=UPI0007FE34E1|nr:hypothetical protein [Mycobacterium sp. E802]OBG86862.1 hypothetical protein A5699_20360 [Mycobacterium sp. E802]